jgi:hypothetical protein
MTTTTLSERDSMIQVYSDFFKDAYGFRPRGINYHGFTLEQLKADFKMFGEVCEANENEWEVMMKWEEEQKAKRKAERKAEAERLNTLKTIGGQFPELLGLLKQLA